jgi:hypothetical protein
MEMDSHVLVVHVKASMQQSQLTVLKAPPRIRQSVFATLDTTAMAKCVDHANSAQHLL